MNMLSLDISTEGSASVTYKLIPSPIISPKSSNNRFSSPLFSPSSPSKRKRASVKDSLRESFAERSQTLARQKHIAQVSRDDKSHVIVRGPSFRDLKTRRSSAPLLSPGTTPLFSPKQARVQDRSEDLLNFHDQQSPIPKRISGKNYLYLTARGVTADLSPRSKYINACFREHLNPRQLLVAKINPLEINLQHQGIGDNMCKVFVECFENLSTVESLNLSDNRLTDTGIATSIEFISTLKALVELDLSDNSAGPTSALSLKNYLGNDKCPLKKLCLRNCFVDDMQLQTILASITKDYLTSKIVSLDLSKNKVGGSDLANENNLTSSDMLAKWLKNSMCTLETLNLSWNMLRPVSFISLGQSLSSNKSLLHLELSYNALGREGGLALGAAITSNHCLKSLDVSNNNLESIAAFTLCVGIMENNSLESVILDGNPIGAKGSTAMMMIPLVHGGRVKLSAKQCNITHEDPECWFNFDKLAGRYILKLNNPFERAISLMLLRMVAFHRSCVFNNIEYDKSGQVITTSGKASAASTKNKNCVKKVDLISGYFNKESLLNEYQVAVAQKMRQLLASSTDAIQAAKLFDDVDTNKDGGLDKAELGKLIHSLGIDLTDFKLRQVMATYDFDGNGSMEVDEFVAFLESSKSDWERHLSDITELPIMILNDATQSAINSNAFPKNCCESGTLRFIPPHSGTILMDVTNERIFKDIFRTLASCDKLYTDNVAMETPDPDLMKQMCLKLTQLRVDDAVAICKRMSKNNISSIPTLRKLLNQVSSVQNARQLVSEVLEDDRYEMMKLKREMGQNLRPTLGMMNGYYLLDVSNELDRECALSLYANSKTINYHKAAKSPLGFGLVGDTSQKGNWSSFRNELFNGRPFVMSESFIQNLPQSGLLEFDYSGEEPPDMSVSIMKDKAIVKVLVNLQLLDEVDVDTTLEELKLIKNRCNECLKGNGQTLYECSWESTLEISTHNSLFFENLGRRSATVIKGMRKEDLIPMDNADSLDGSNEKNDSAEDSPTDRVEPNGLALNKDSSKKPNNTLPALKPAFAPSHSNDLVLHINNRNSSKAPSSMKQPNEYTKYSYHKGVESLMDDHEVHNATKGDHYYGVVKALTNLQSEIYFKNLTEMYNITPQAKMKRLLDIIEESFACYKWIRSRHLALILRCISKLLHGNIDRHKYFGNYRVEVVVMLFGHIVDIFNFELVLKELTPYEHACVGARIGPLNYFNALKPEGSINCDLSHWDQRQIVKMLIALETREPGENWIQKQFRWTIDSPPIPGWVLTKSYTTEEGLPHRGILDIMYYSGGGYQRNGCIPIVPIRKSLLYMTAIEENTVVQEPEQECRMVAADPSVVNVGLLALRSDLDFWNTFLCHNLVTSDKVPSAVTAPRRVQNRAGQNNNASSIPVYSNHTSSKGVVEKGGELLPVNGNMNAAVLVALNSTPSKFKMLDSLYISPPRKSTSTAVLEALPALSGSMNATNQSINTSESLSSLSTLSKRISDTSKYGYGAPNAPKRNFIISGDSLANTSTKLNAHQRARQPSIAPIFDNSAVYRLGSIVDPGILAQINLVRSRFTVDPIDNAANSRSTRGSTGTVSELRSTSDAAKYSLADVSKAIKTKLVSSSVSGLS